MLLNECVHILGDYHCQIADMNSCDGNTTNEAVTSVLSTSSNLEANEALSVTNHNFSQNQCKFEVFYCYQVINRL